MDIATESDAPDSWDAIRRIADKALGDVDALADSLMPRLLASIPAYQKTPLEDMRAAVITNIRGALLGLAERRPLSQAELAENEALIEARVHQGLPLEAILEALRVGAQFVWDRVEAQARLEGIDADVLLVATKLMWNRIDVLMTSDAVTFRRAELAMVRHDQQRQSDFLRDLLLGEPDDAQLSTLAPAFGLTLDRPYVCVRARPTSATSLEEVRRTISAAMPDARSGLLGIIQGDLAGVLPEAPRVADSAMTVGVGPPRRLSSIGSSFLLASRALETALAFGRTGVFRIEDVALHAAVLAEDQVGGYLVERYLRPLSAERDQGSVIEGTLREYLAQGMRVEQTARALFVHPNTLRNRLHRFEELTGADLGRVEDVVGLWWALERGSLDRGAEL